MADEGGKEAGDCRRRTLQPIEKAQDLGLLGVYGFGKHRLRPPCFVRKNSCNVATFMPSLNVMKWKSPRFPATEM